MADKILKSIQRGPLERAHLLDYAEASLDFNPIHLDESFAQRAGFPSVIAHGMLSMAFMGDWIKLNFPAPFYRVDSFSCRFKKVTFPGDHLVIDGMIKKQKEHEIHLDIKIINQKSEVTSHGEAVLVRAKEKIENL